MEDLIKRSDAIKAIANLHILADEEKIFRVYADNPHSMTTDFEGTLIDAINAIKSIPSADRPQGEWIKDEDGTYRCSNCGGCEEQYIYGTENWYGCGESKFCPSCGARMRPKLQGKSFDSIIIDECAMKGADDE